MPDPVVTIVRDPVARYISAWDMCARQGHLPQYDSWPTASDAALDDEAHAWLLERYLHAFEPLTLWLEDAAHAQRCWYIAHTETLDDDIGVICDRLGIERRTMPPPGDQHRNDHTVHGTVKSTLTEEAERAIRDRYAGDYRLLEGLARR